MNSNQGVAIIRALCAWYAAETGDRSFLRASNTFVHSPPGRRPKYPARADQLMIDEAHALLADGKAGSIHGALLLVAKSKHPFMNPKSVAQRLTRKIKRDLRLKYCEDERERR